MDELDQMIEDGARAAPHLDFIRSVVQADILERDMADQVGRYVAENLNSEFGCVVFDLMSSLKIISKPKYRELMTHKSPKFSVDVDRYRAL